MTLKAKTLLFAFFLIFLAFVAINFFSIYWTSVLVSMIFLFIGSMFFFIYLDFSHAILPSMKKWPSVSVIIPCYNAEETIEKCIESVKKMSYNSRFEIIVVNDASKDSSLSILKKIPGIKLLNKTKNAGKAAAINSGLKISKGEIVCCIDSDTFPSSDALEKTVPFFADEKTGAVTCLIRVYKPNTFFKMVQELEYLLGFGFYQTMLSNIGAAMVTPGPMCVYRKKALLEVGGFDEYNITEDMEICLRLQKNFYKIKGSHSAIVYTVVPTTLSQWITQRTRWYRGKIFNTIKYRDLLFNPKHGFLGSFSLPFTFLIEMASVFILFLLAVFFGQSLLFGLDVLLSGFSANYFVPVELPGLIVHSSAVFFFVVTLSTFGFGLYIAFDLARQRFSLRHVLPVLFIIMFYGVMISSIWLVSLFKEVNRSEYKW